MADSPRWALVVWRDSYTIGNLPIAYAERMLLEGRVVLYAREDEESCQWPVGESVGVEPSQRNPNRTGDEGGD